MGACGSKMFTCCQGAKTKEKYTQPVQAQDKASFYDKMAVTDKSRETFKEDYEGSGHSAKKRQKHKQEERGTGAGTTQVIDYLETMNIGCTTSIQHITNNVQERKKEKPASLKPHSHHEDKNAGDKLAKDKKNDRAVLILQMLTKTAESVGIIRGPGECQGTGFLLKEGMVMTAAHVINKLRDLNGNLSENFTRENTISIQFGYKQQSDIQKQPFFYFMSEILYINREIDVAVLQIRLEADTSKKLPRPLETFSPVQPAMKGELIGHPDGEPQRIDPDIERFELSNDVYEKARQWSMDEYNENGYEGIQDKRKILFHCGFAHGASGSPGVYADPTKEHCEVAWILLEGYPGFYHKSLSREQRDRIPKTFLIEQGITMKAIWEDMDKNKKELCLKIFGHRNESFHPISDPSSSLTLA